MELLEIRDQKTWDAFIASGPWAQFAQSWDWGEFQRSVGHDIRRYALRDANGVALACQLIRYDRRFFCYWFAPRGPVFGEYRTPRNERRKIHEEFLSRLARQRLPGRTLFYRFEPAVRIEDGRGLMPIRMRRTHAMNPAATTILDLARPDEELLAAMHPKTRYNIRLAAKHGIAIREGYGKADMDAFLRLMEETESRDRFHAHGADYLRATHDFLRLRNMSRLRLAEYHGTPIAANLEIAYGDTVTYLHGASSSACRELMAPHLLQWEAIRAAKISGFRFYDFWGTNPESKAGYYYKPSWEGITRFKLGFGGTRVDLLGTWDLPMNRFFYQLAFPENFWR